MNTTKKAILMICVLVLALVLATVVMADCVSLNKKYNSDSAFTCSVCKTCYSPDIKKPMYRITNAEGHFVILTDDGPIKSEGASSPLVAVVDKSGESTYYQFDSSGNRITLEGADIMTDSALSTKILTMTSSQEYKTFVASNTQSSTTQPSTTSSTLTATQLKDKTVIKARAVGMPDAEILRYAGDSKKLETLVANREYNNMQARIYGLNPADKTAYPDSNTLYNAVTRAAAKRARDTGIITEKRYQELTRDDAKAESWKKLNSWYQSKGTQKDLKETTDWATIGLSATPPASVYTVAETPPKPMSKYANMVTERDGQTWKHDDKGKPIACLTCDYNTPPGMKMPDPPAKTNADYFKGTLNTVTVKVTEGGKTKDVTHKVVWTGAKWVCYDCPRAKLSDPKALAKWKKSQAALYKKAKPIYDDVVIKNSLVTKEDAQKLLKQGDAGLAKLKTAGLVGQKASSIGANPNEVYTYCSKTKECSSATLGVDPARGDFKIYAGGKTADGVKFQADTGWECVSCAATGEGAEELGVKKPCYPKCTDAEMYAEDAVFKDKSGRLMKSEGYEPFKDSAGTEYKSMDECRSKSKDKKSCSGGFQGYKAVEYYWVPGSWTDILQGGPTVNIMKSFGTFFPKWKDPFGYGSWFDTHFNLEQSTQTQVCKAAFDVESEGVGISPTGSAIPTVSIQGIKNKVEPCIGLRGDSKTACLEFNNLTTSKDYYWNYKITGKVIPKDCNMKFNIFIDTVAMYDKPRELKKGDAPFDLTGAGAIVTKNAAVPADAGRICIRFDDLNAGCLLTKLMHENADGNHRLICNKIRDADVNEEWKDAGFDSFVDFGDDLDTTSSSTTEGCTLC